jgi:hypothetical protein
MIVIISIASILLVTAIVWAVIEKIKYNDIKRQVRGFDERDIY